MLLEVREIALYYLGYYVNNSLLNRFILGKDGSATLLSEEKNANYFIYINNSK